MENEQLSVRDVISILFLRKWTIITVFIGVVGIASLLAFYLLSPTFEASTSILINSSYLVIPLTDATPVSDFEKLSAFNTQKDIITSATIASDVVAQLHLDQTRAIGRIERMKLWAKAQRRTLGHWLGIASWQKPENYRALAVDALMANLAVESKPESAVLKISYRAKNPDEASKTLNAVIATYSDNFNQQIDRRAKDMIDYFSERMASVKDALSSTEGSILTAREHDTINLQKGGHNSASPAQDDASVNLTGVTDSATTQDELKVYVLSMEEDLRKLKAEYTEHYPAVIELEAKIKRYTQALNTLPKREMSATRLKRELDVDQDEFLFLRKNLEHAKLIAAGNTNKMNIINIVDHAEANDDPVAPKPRLLIMAALVFGLLFGVVLALVQDFLDHTLRSSRDMHKYLGLKPIGSLEKLS